tara:strand:+ start:112 stop:339 length:228 start_codon:yes stop_codon:yes gene_type:complete
MSFEELDKMMDNSEIPQFNYETFDAAFKADDRIKNIVSNYDGEKISFGDSLPKGGGDQDTVSTMAKRATNVGDNL